MADTPSLDEILSQAENPSYRRVATAKVLLRQDLTARHAELDVELQAALERDAITNEPDKAPAIAKQLRDLETEIEDAKVEFRFANIGHRAWADLLAKHPPKQEKGGRRSNDPFNPATFPAAAIAAACIAPEGVDELAAKRLEVALDESQFAALFNAAVDANVGGTQDSKSLAASQILRASERFASSASEKGERSLAASSSDE